MVVDMFAASRSRGGGFYVTLCWFSVHHSFTLRGFVPNVV